jgi:hypothetical protein
MTMQTIAHTLATADECRRLAKGIDNDGQKQFYLDLEQRLRNLAALKMWLCDSVAAIRIGGD